MIYKDWPEYITQDYIKSLMFKEDKDSRVCKICLNNNWECARINCSLLKLKNDLKENWLFADEELNKWKHINL